MWTLVPASQQSLFHAWASAAKAALVLFCMAVTAASAADGAAPANKCATGQLEVKVAVGLTSKTASFVCGTPLVHLLPKREDTSSSPKCFKEKDCTTPTLCSAVVGADVDLSVAEAVGADNRTTDKGYTVKVQRLPTEAKVVYFQCSQSDTQGAGGRTTNCTVEVAVPAKPAADTCAENNEAITVEVDATQKSATFNCGGDLTALRPAENTKVFKDDCSTEVSLEAELSSATLTSKDSKNTLALTELPKADKTLCYKCVGAAPESSPAQACTVKVKVPASGSQSVATGAGVGILAGVILAVVTFL